MVTSTDYNQYGTLKDIAQQLRSMLAKTTFLTNKQTLSKSDLVTLKMQNLLITSNGYFGPECRLYMSSQYITLAQVLRTMQERGEKLSRSGCENRILLDVQKFVKDFGPETAYLLNNTEKIENPTWLSVIELKIIAIQTGFDYTDNILDKTLKQHGLGVISLDGYSTLNKDITDDEVKRFIELIEPYTKSGLAKRKEQLEELGHIAWAFRKGIIDGSNNELVTTILRHI